MFHVKALSYRKTKGKQINFTLFPPIVPSPSSLFAHTFETRPHTHEPVKKMKIVKNLMANLEIEEREMYILG